MTETYNYLSDTEVSDWIQRWSATFFPLAGLLGLSIESGSGQNDPKGHAQSVISLWTDELAASNLAEVDVLRQVAYDLLSFSAQHLAFVLDTFYGGQTFQLVPLRSKSVSFGEWHIRKLINSEVGNGYQPSKAFAGYALRRVLGQFNQDVLALHAIWTQKQTLDDIKTETVTNRRQANVELAENVRKAFSSFLPDTKTPFVYLRSWGSTRLIPASVSPLISVPPSALINQSDSLAIPHEMGHFLFWRGESQGELLRNKLDTKINTLAKVYQTVKFDWREEIFADVVGTLFGGPVVVDSLTRMMKEKVGQLALEHNGHHPIPLVRPYALFRVLQQCPAPWPVVGDRLASEWNNWIVNEGYSLDQGVELVETVDLDTPTTALQTVPLATLRDDLALMATAIVEFFVGEGISLEQMTARWRDAKSDDLNAYTALTAQAALPDPLTGLQVTSTKPWSEVVRAAFPKDASAYDLLGTVPFANANWAINRLQLPVSEPAQPADSELSFEEWFTILALGGWGDAGPTGGSPHKIG